LALAGPLQSLDRRLQQAEPAGQSGDQGVSLAEPGVEVGDQICDQRAQLSVLLTGIPGQHPGDSLVVIGGHRLQLYSTARGQWWIFARSARIPVVYRLRGDRSRPSVGER